jgi:hypothetical protein
MYDEQLNYKAKSGSRRSDDIKAVEVRTILRGAAMDALVTAAGGNESILSSGGAHELLVSPWVYFRISPGDKEEKLAAAILKGSDEIFPAFTQALATHFSSNKPLLELLQEHADLIRNTVLGPNVPTPPSQKSKPSQQKKGTRKLKDCGPTSATHILPSNSAPSLLPIASILREACNNSRALPVADKALGDVLQGVSPTNRQSHPPEQTDPIRGNNAYTQLLLQILPPARLTSREGISALLAYMGTGQCTATKDFLTNNQEMFFDYHTCVTAFQTVKSANDSIHNSNPAIQRAISKGRQPKKFVPGMVQFEFSRVWGQPCCHLSLRDGIVERLQPMFGEEI